LVCRDCAAHRADFASKVHVARADVRALKGIEYDFIGTLDVDISLESDYFQKPFRAFEQCPLRRWRGHMIEAYDGRLVPQRVSADIVASAVQMFSRQAFEDVGGLLPMRLGGEDSVTEILAGCAASRWATSFELQVRHRGRALSGGARPTRAWFAGAW
jgi:hypothetical protein